MPSSFYSEKPSRDLENLTDKQKLLLGKAGSANGLNNTGVSCGHLIEPVPRFIRADCEEVVNKNAQDRNAWIVVGRDRHGTINSGYGGVGATQAGMIDLVVGRGGANPDSNDYLDNAFQGDSENSDCARIYISQKCDIDKYFGLAEGLKIGNPKAVSGIGMKADGIRLIGTNGIKLVTGGRTETNSKGLNVDIIQGIELIAGNISEDESQPLVKGENLIECLQSMQSNLDELNGVVDAISRSMRRQAIALASHVHVAAPIVGGPTTPGTNVVNGVRTAIDSTLSELTAYISKINQFMQENEYLEPMGPKYICSKYNTTN
jgi:hypothetical protein